MRSLQVVFVVLTLCVAVATGDSVTFNGWNLSSDNQNLNIVANDGTNQLNISLTNIYGFGYNGAVNCSNQIILPPWRVVTDYSQVPPELVYGLSNVFHVKASVGVRTGRADAVINIQGGVNNGTTDWNATTADGRVVTVSPGEMLFDILGTWPNPDYNEYSFVVCGLNGNITATASTNLKGILSLFGDMLFFNSPNMKLLSRGGGGNDQNNGTVISALGYYLRIWLYDSPIYRYGLDYIPSQIHELEHAIILGYHTDPLDLSATLNASLDIRNLYAGFRTSFVTNYYGQTSKSTGGGVGGAGSRPNSWLINIFQMLSY